jgi:hypothetical protein
MLGRHAQWIVKELKIISSSNDQVLSYKIKSPYDWDKIPAFIRRFNTKEGYYSDWDDGDISYSEMKDVLRKETASATAIYCFGEHKVDIISKLIDHPVTDILQLPQSGLVSMLCTYTYLYMFMHFITGGNSD